METGLYGGVTALHYRPTDEIRDSCTSDWFILFFTSKIHISSKNVKYIDITYRHIRHYKIIYKRIKHRIKSLKSLDNNYKNMQTNLLILCHEKYYLHSKFAKCWNIHMMIKYRM